MTSKALGEQYDAVIIGSGFGGSVSALRLAQAKKRVAVLERGGRWNAGEFPRDPKDGDRVFWRWPNRPSSRGLYDLRFFSSLGAIVASGVGGGSLVYANINIRPDADVFEDPRWPKAIRRSTLDPYFDRVAAMLGLAPAPPSLSLKKRDAFHKAASALGRDVFDPDQAVTWDSTREGALPGRASCQLCSQCEFGCQHGAKNTCDLTYLAKAEALGARVFPGIHVSVIEPLAGVGGSGGYRVRYRDVETGAEGSVVGAKVIVSAGTLGTNEILLRSRDESKTLPNLSSMLGRGYSANGDMLGNIENSAADLEPWRGPDVTSVMRFGNKNSGGNGNSGGPYFTVAAPGFTRGVTAVLASLGQPRLGMFRYVAPAMRPFLGDILPWMFERGMMSKPLWIHERNAGDPSRMTNLFAIGRDNANGRFRLRGGKLDLTWDFANENRALVTSMIAAMTDIARAYGGTFAPIALWGAFERILTVHSLGGCRMAESPEHGVVSPDGEVFGYPSLFVADGSVIPTSIGFHPAMTIAAVSERIADNVAASFS